MPHQPYSAMLLLLLATVALIRAWAFYRYRREKFGQALDQATQDLLVKIVRLGSAVPTVLWIFTPSLGFAQLNLPPAVRILGAAFFLGGALLLLWVHRVMGSLFSPVVQLKENHRLITSGPFRYIRHPMYSSVLACILGGFLLTANWAYFLIQVCIFTALILLRVPEEERMLAGRFPAEFEVYRQKTWQIIPFVY
jgi:protein-S-isoprenylcysteine O-methyltransferase Ste14